MSRPFLKWAGGKHRQMEYLARRLPKGQRLIEPFAGSGAVFMGTDYESYVLADCNRDLIDLFLVVSDHGQRFIDYARTYFTEENNSPEKYYSLRQWFNEQIPMETPCPQRAALFLYLNRHGYNGLCRYNRSGKFNVPFGRYKRPYFPETELRLFQIKAKRCDVQFIAQPYTRTMEMADAGDVVYCDPPYVPLNESGFDSYTPGDFTPEDHLRLAQSAMAASIQGAHVVISNHSTRSINSTYRDYGASLAFRSVLRSISRNGGDRKPVSEVLATFKAKPAARAAA